MNSEFTQTLEDALRVRLRPEDLALYERLHAAHFFAWKVHRFSEPDSLRVLRRLLYSSRVATLQRARVNETSQPFHDYADELGLPLDRFDFGDRLSSLQNPDHPGVRLFAEPGDGFNMYAKTRLGWVSYGIGEALTFSLEETLRNCLKDDIREDDWNALSAHRCPAFERALKQLEFWSVRDVVLGLSGSYRDGNEAEALAPFDALANLIDGAAHGVDLAAVVEIGEQAADLLRRHQSAFAHAGQEVFFGTMLGFLIDELVARSTVPNGMNFWYAQTEGTLTAMRERIPEIREIIESIGTNPDELTTALDTLTADCRAVIDAPNAVRVPDERWRDTIEHLADRLRTLGHTLRVRRRSDEASANLVFVTSNTLWRWLFFDEHRDRRAILAALGVSAEDRERAAEFMLRWLRRPWGVLSVADIDQGFRGIIPGDEYEELPRAFTVLAAFLQSEPEQYLADTFKVRDPDRARTLLLRFIGFRYLVYACRQRVTSVHLDSDADGSRAKARLWIELFTAWAYGNTDGSRLDLLGDTDEIIRLLRSGDWCHELLDEPAAEAAGTPITIQQRALAQEYLVDPEALCERLFRFGEEDFLIEEHIGLMPPELFSFLPRREEAPAAIEEAAAVRRQFAAAQPDTLPRVPPSYGASTWPWTPVEAVESALRAEARTDREHRVREAVRSAGIYALGHPAADTSVPGRGTESDLLQFTRDDDAGAEVVLLPVFTNPTAMREALIRNPDWQTYSVLQINGGALLDNVDDDVTIVINPWSDLEYQLLPRRGGGG